MTLTDHRAVANWWAVPVTTLDHPRIADFLATTGGLGGRRFASDSRDVAEHFDGVLEGGANVVLDDAGEVRGYALLRKPHGNEICAEFVFDPVAPTAAVDEVVGSAVAHFHDETTDQPAAYLRATVGRDQQDAIEALTRRGASREAEFVWTRKPLDGESATQLAALAIPGLAVLSWPALISRGLGEQVRLLHDATFLGHRGIASKAPAAFDHHIRNRAFTPDFSNAAVDGTGTVVGYVLGSTFTAGAAPNNGRSAHTDYIGVCPDQRNRGIGELLLRKVWLAALRRGFTAASLDADTDNRGDAHLLHRRLGYVSMQSRYAYRIAAVRGSGRPARRW